jgi:hypothetical protein
MAFDMGPVAKRIEQRHRNRSKHPRPYRHPSRKSSRDRKETNFYHNSTSFFDTEAREKKQSPQKKTEEESNKKRVQRSIHGIPNVSSTIKTTLTKVLLTKFLEKVFEVSRRKSESVE